MAPRAYHSETRQQQQAELKARIASAAAALHAERGVLATSYAEVADRAGVSVPTVYKHYPDLDQLVRGCTAHVSGQAPPVPAQAILESPSLQHSVERLVDSMLGLHGYYEPWMAWREAGRIPALAEMAASARQQVGALCLAVLERHRIAGDRRELAAVWESLLNFELWHRLVRVHKLSRAAVRRRLIHLLLAAAGLQPATPSRPAQRKSP